MPRFIITSVETITKVHLYEMEAFDEETVREGFVNRTIPVTHLTTYQPAFGSDSYIKEIRRA